MEFRSGAVDSVEQHPEECREFLVQDCAVWSNAMLKSGEYGDQLAVVGLTEYTGCPILVYRRLLPAQRATVALPLEYTAEGVATAFCLLLDETSVKPEQYTALTIAEDDLWARGCAFRAEGKSQRAIV